MTRRKFCKIFTANIVAFSLLWKLAVGGNNEKSLIDISQLNINLPRWLFDSSSKSHQKVKVIFMKKQIPDDLICLSFSDDLKLCLKSKTSAIQQMKRNNNFASKRSMSQKRFTSYALDTIAMGRQRPIHASKREFDKLQNEEVLNRATISSIYQLIADINGLAKITSIRWDFLKHRFEVL